MIAIIFEVLPAEGKKDDYLNAAAQLRSDLMDMPGFISVERFQSLSDPDKLLSLSFFEDEDAVARWRNHAMHRDTQARGRSGLFRDYRIRVAEVARDFGLNDRYDAPSDSQAKHG